MAVKHPTRKLAPTRPEGVPAAHEKRRGYTVKEAAEILGCCERTVRNEIDNGTLSSYRVGKRGIRIPCEAVDKRVAWYEAAVNKR